MNFLWSDELKFERLISEICGLTCNIFVGVWKQGIIFYNIMN